MKRIGLVLLALLFAQQVMGQGDALTLFAQANTTYESGDYARAIALYHAVEAVSIEDSRVYYNLGHAYYQVGDTGQALLYYLRAQVLNPRDGDLSANIALVRTERVDIEGDETGILDGLAALTTGVLHLLELVTLIGLAWALWCGLLAVHIVQPRWREMLRGPLLVIGVLTLLGGLLLVSRVYVAENRPAAVVVAPRAQVMSGPGADYLPLYPLYAAAEIRLVDSRDGWIRFSLPDGRQGWLPGEVVVRVESQP
jgi:tetratricopeptide (TPR) repeat protein